MPELKNILCTHREVWIWYQCTWLCVWAHFSLGKRCQRWGIFFSPTGRSGSCPQCNRLGEIYCQCNTTVAFCSFSFFSTRSTMWCGCVWLCSPTATSTTKSNLDDSWKCCVGLLRSFETLQNLQWPFRRSIVGECLSKRYSRLITNPSRQLLVPIIQWIVATKQPGRCAKKRHEGVVYELQAAQRLCYSLMINTVHVCIQNGTPAPLKK